MTIYRLMALAIAAVVCLNAQLPRGGNGGGGGGAAPAPNKIDFTSQANSSNLDFAHTQGTDRFEATCRTSAGAEIAVSVPDANRTSTAGRVTFPASGGPFTGSCRVFASGPGQTGGAGAAGTNGTDGQPRQIQDEGVDLTIRGKMNIIGAGVTCVDNPAQNRTDCTFNLGGAVDSVFGRTGAVTAQSGDYNAGQITNTPAGGIAANTVQGALNELDTEKAASSHTHAQSEVTGLPTALTNRPVKAAGYANSKAAIINSSGEIDKAPGSDSDCVRVDGSSGPCGTGSGVATTSTTFAGETTKTITNPGFQATNGACFNGSGNLEIVPMTVATSAPYNITFTPGVAFTGVCYAYQGGASGDVSTSGSYSNPSWITGLAATKINSGTLATARLGSGTANSGTVLHGDQAWKPISTTSSTCIQLDDDATGPKICNDLSGGFQVKDSSDNVLMTVDTAGALTLGDGTAPWNLTGLTDDTPPSAPGTANQFTAYVDRTTGLFSYILNGETVKTPALGKWATFTGPSAARTYTLPDANATLTRTIASGTAALGTSAIASGACATAVTVSATGVLTTDTITFTPNADITAVTGYAPVTTGGLAIYPYPTADSVSFKVCNPTSSSITPGAVTLNFRVVR